ncbi:MAG: integrase arm-type DNA-binding domain-containing protein [Magnetococcales bacterium]|nr:integrase arm-type DNA-binding domain-containing protein [Magnetococcales bacterium]
MPLSDAKLRNLKPKTKAQKIFDGGGLYIQVTPAGSKRWRIKYRINGLEKLLSLGIYPEVSLKEARERRDQIRRQLADGIDPSEERKKEKIKANLEAENSFMAIAEEWLQNERGRWTERHYRTVSGRLARDIYPAFGQEQITDIKPMIVLEALRAIEARGAVDLPKRMRGTISNIFKYGIITGRCEANPAGDLQGALKPHKVQHQKAIPPSELPILLAKIEDYDCAAAGDLQTKLALKFLALTFVRTGEMRFATWDEIDLNSQIWRIPAQRMKMRDAHIVPLAHQTVTILEQLKEMNGMFEWVFAGRSPQRPMSENTALYALYRLGYHGRMTGHGFRAVASTVLNEMGYRADVIERQLAHEERNKVRAAYNRSQYLDERRKMMQDWADHLDGLAKNTNH